MSNAMHAERSRYALSALRSLGALLLFGVLLAACGASSPSAQRAPASSEAAPAIGVPWADYAADVRTRIEAATAARDCSALREEFNIADANGEATMSRTGHNNAALMEFIDAQLQAAGCN